MAIQWSDYRLGSWTKVKTPRGTVRLHVWPHGLKKAHPAHPYKIEINNKCIGYATTLEPGKKFAESFINWRKP